MSASQNNWLKWKMQRKLGEFETVCPHGGKSDVNFQLHIYIRQIIVSSYYVSPMLEMEGEHIKKQNIQQGAEGFKITRS